MERLLPTSVLRLRAWPPASWILRAVRAAESGSMSVHSTVAPRAPNASAVCSPMPEPAPVITTSLPLSGPSAAVTRARCRAASAGAPSI